MAKKKFKFPDPSDYPSKSPVVLCPADRVLALYNQDNEATAKRISKKVREWVTTIALENKWKGVHFLPEVQSNHGAGCLLLNDKPDTESFSSMPMIEEKK